MFSRLLEADILIYYQRIDTQPNPTKDLLTLIRDMRRRVHQGK